MRKFVIAIPPAAINTAFTIAINTAIEPLEPFKINISDGEKAGMRSMAEGREGYVRLISRIATQYPNALSREDLPAELVDLLAYYDKQQANRMALLEALELVEEGSLATATDIMALADRYNANMAISRRNNSALDLAMREVDEWNKRFGNRKDEEEGEEE